MNVPAAGMVPGAKHELHRMSKVGLLNVDTGVSYVRLSA